MKNLQRLAPYLERLRELPFVRGARAVAPKAGFQNPFTRTAREIDAEIILHTIDASEHHCPCELRSSHLGREAAIGLVQARSRHPGLLVLAPAVGRELGDLFAAKGVNFMDLAGNCHVRLDHRFVARVQGRIAPKTAATSKGLRAASYAVLLALLIDETLLRQTTRAIAAAAGGVSPQTVADLLGWLIEQGFALDADEGLRWAPTGWVRARDLWLGGWTTTHLPNLLVGRFRARPQDIASLEKSLGTALADIAPWRWGGGAAADRLTGYYRGDRTVVYVENPPADLARRLVLAPSAEGNVFLIRSPGPLAFKSPHTETVNPLLVYADLLAEEHERAHEAAHELATRHLPPSDDRA